MKLIGGRRTLRPPPPPPLFILMMGRSKRDRDQNIRCASRRNSYFVLSLGGWGLTWWRKLFLRS